MEQHDFNKLIVKFMDENNKEKDISYLGIDSEKLKKLVKNANGSFRTEKEVKEMGHPKQTVVNRYFYVIENENGQQILGRMYGHFI